MKIPRKAIIVVIIIILAIGFVILANYLKQVNDYKSKVENMTFSNVDISSVPDGKYVGESDVDLISAKVEVLVKDGTIISIDLLRHENGKGTPAEQIMAKMIKEQTTDVDTISGATNSCKVIRKAVENALLGK